MAQRKRPSNDYEDAGTAQRRRPDELFEEIDRLKVERGKDPQVEQLLHELQVYHEELTVQNHQLQDAQAQLEAARDRYADLYDFAPVGFLTLDGNGVIHELNLTASALVGRPRARIEGMPLTAFARDDFRRVFLDFMQRCRNCAPGEAPTVALTLVTPDGEREVEVVCRPRPAELPDAPQFLAAIVDQTERNRLERERRRSDEERDRLRQSQAVAAASAAAKDQFLARLSHELRTPLTPVLAALTDPALTRQAPPGLRDTLLMMRRDIELEVRLIDDLLDVTRINRKRFVIARHPVDVHDAIAHVASMLAPVAAERGSRIVTRPDAKVHWISGDSTRLRQVLWNLITNALKFTPRDGVVTVTTSNVGEAGLQVEVSDTGRGMDATTVERLFRAEDGPPGAIAPEAGLGLGLAICRGIVEAHGGTIVGASPGPNHGSSFSLVLPAAFTPRLETGTSPAGTPDEVDRGRRAAPDDGQLRILLVEDDEDTAVMLSALLELHAFRVEIARSMTDAVEMSLSRHWDLMISDIRLPDGSGLELIRRLGNRRAGRAIAVSGFGSSEDVRRSLEAGFDEHLVKPINMGMLLERIDRYFGPRAVEEK